jgi:hypothetical protein
MQGEDLSSRIGLTLIEVIRHKRDELAALQLQNSLLTDQVEEGKAAIE